MSCCKERYTPKEGLNIKGTIAMKKKVVILIRDRETGKVLDRRESDEVMTVASRRRAANRWASFGGETGISWVVVLGSGTGTPSENDTTLFQPEYDTEKSPDVTINDNIVTFHVYYFPWEANGRTYSELGLFLKPSECSWTYGDQSGSTCYKPDRTFGCGCIMLEHGTFTGITKTDAIFLDIYITVTFI